jgi:hypothetical protein
MAYKTGLNNRHHGGPWKLPALTRIVAFLGALGLVAAADLAKAAPADTGVWSPVYQLPAVPIHTHVLPDGKLLFWQDDNNKVGSPSTNNSVAYVVDVPPTFLPNSQTNLFCAGHAFLSDGRLLVIGGQENAYYKGVTTTTLFHTAGGHRWETLAGSEMRDRRWYPTAIPLANGEVLAIGGTKESSGDRNLIPELWKTSGGWRALTTASLSVPPYAWVFQARNGKVLFAGPKGASRYLDIAGTGKWSAAPTRKVGDRTRGAAVMYDTGKILLVGGNGTATAETIDLLAATPAWKTVAPMKNARIYHHATVLPDGTVLVTHGTNPGGSVLAAELWNPASNTGPRWLRPGSGAAITRTRSCCPTAGSGLAAVAGRTASRTRRTRRFSPRPICSRGRGRRSAPPLPPAATGRPSRSRHFRPPTSARSA